MAEYVRNTVIPSKIDEKTVIDDIVEKIYLYQNINSKPNCTLEIEGKIGKIVLNDNKFFDLLKTMEKLSTRNYININEININKRFESGFNEELYYKNLNYFENVYNLKEKIHFSKIKDEYLKMYLEHFNQIKEEITIDFVSGNKTKKTRITYRLFDNSYEFLEKTNLIHFDILHNSNKKMVF